METSPTDSSVLTLSGRNEHRLRHPPSFLPGHVKPREPVAHVPASFHSSPTLTLCHRVSTYATISSYTAPPRSTMEQRPWPAIFTTGYVGTLRHLFQRLAAAVDTRGIVNLIESAIRETNGPLSVVPRGRRKYGGFFYQGRFGPVNSNDPAVTWGDRGQPLGELSRAGFRDFLAEPRRDEA